ncbi:MAG: hypothetical protein DWQ01_14660 [Planctomycetota bacterium]|nr:MAG: hypothetical protein DWQ01_14660 [Planctomycetota bacterium]
MKLPFPLLLSVIVLSGGAALPAQQALPPAFQGDYQGLERGPMGQTLGRLHFEPILDGQWTWLAYQRDRGGQPITQKVQVFRAQPDGSVLLWSFHEQAGVEMWQGRLSPRDLSLKRLDAEGTLLELQVYDLGGEFLEHFHLKRSGRDEALQEFLTAEYRRAPEAGFAPMTEAAQEKARAQAFAYYLGTFSGQEQAGENSWKGWIQTLPWLDGSWFRSDYRALDEHGKILYQGFGMTRSLDPRHTEFYWFDVEGKALRYQGEFVEGGYRAFLGQAEQPLETHFDRWSKDGYKLKIRRRAQPWLEWNAALQAEYRRIDD